MTKHRYCLAFYPVFGMEKNCLTFPLGIKVWHFLFRGEKNQSSFEKGHLWPCESVANGGRMCSFQVTTRGFAQYELFKSTALDDTLAASQTTITLDISWSPVDEILQSPPLSSTATLVGANSFCVELIRCGFTFNLLIAGAACFQPQPCQTALRGPAYP